MRNANLSTVELLEYSGEHVLYEIQLFQFAARELSRLEKATPTTSVFIESFCIHLRNLIDFFYTKPGKEMRDDDVIAADFCPGWDQSQSLPSTLRAARERANKELGHLTLKRKSGFDPSKPWDVNGLFQEVSAVARKFVAQAPPQKLNPEVRKWVEQYPLLATIGSIVTSNTTATMKVTKIVNGP